MSMEKDNQKENSIEDLENDGNDEDYEYNQNP